MQGLSGSHSCGHGSLFCIYDAKSVKNMQISIALLL